MQTNEQPGEGQWPHVSVSLHLVKKHIVLVSTKGLGAAKQQHKPSPSLHLIYIALTLLKIHIHYLRQGGHVFAKSVCLSVSNITETFVDRF